MGTSGLRIIPPATRAGTYAAPKPGGGGMYPRSPGGGGGMFATFFVYSCSMTASANLISSATF